MAQLTNAADVYLINYYVIINGHIKQLMIIKAYIFLTEIMLSVSCSVLTVLTQVYKSSIHVDHKHI